MHTYIRANTEIGCMMISVATVTPPSETALIEMLGPTDVAT